MNPEPLVRNVSDTALWAAVYRAQETERPDAVFRDIYARQLAGERGMQIASANPFHDQNSWSWVARTWVFDRFIEAQVQQGVQVIINVAAGLDARPYRMDLPASLSWIEVDRQEILDYKNRIIGDAAPKCLLERRALDFRDLRVQTEFLSSLDASKKTLVVTEGYLIYLTAEEVSVLAGNLADRRQISAWAADIVSPGLLHMLQANTELNDAARLQFGPANGPSSFAPMDGKQRRSNPC